MRAVLFVIPSPLAFKQFMERLAVRMISENYSVHVVCKRYDDNVYIDSVNYHFIDFERNLGIREALQAGRRINDIVQQVKPVVVHAHFSSAAFVTFLARRRNWPPALATIQGAISTVIRPWTAKLKIGLAEIMSFRSFSETYVLTDDDYRSLKPFVPRLRIQQTPGFGCELERFDPATVTPKLMRSDVGLHASDFVLIYVGRLTSFKGFPIVVKSFWELHRRYSHIRLIVCGKLDPIHSHGLTDDELKSYQDDNAIVKTGFTNDVYSYLRMADLNFFPSEREGMPVNLMESISAGVPVITSAARGCRHVVTDQVNGVVVEKNTVEAYVHAIGRFVDDPSSLNVMKSNCLSNRESFDREHFVQEMLTRYKELASNIS